ncbi:MAG: PAS domain S-box protein [Paludibacter sp.]|nr:PAS domain S-box protein [Paludibacter sp.]
MDEIKDLYESNEQLKLENERLKRELDEVNVELQNSIEDNQKNVSFIEAIYNSVPGLLYLFDDEGKLVRWNKKIEILLGYTADELQDIHVIDLFINDEQSIRAVQSAMDKIDVEGFAELEARLRRKDGTYLPMHFTAVPVQIGGIQYFTGIGVDISQQKRTQKELIESEKKYRSLFEDHSAVKLLIDAEDGSIVDANLAASDYYGWSRGELMQMKISDINTLPPSEVKEKIQLISHNEQKHFEFRHRHKDGSVSDVEVFSTRIDFNGEKFIHSIIHDVSERKKVEEELKANYSLIKVAGETAKFGGWSYKVGDDKLDWSDSVCKIHELPVGTIIDVREAMQYYTPESQEIVSKVFNKCLRNAIPYDLELQIVTAKGRKVWVRTTGEAVQDENGHVVKVQGSFQDINERKIINIALNESERRLSTLISNLPGFVYRCANDKDWTMFYISDVCEEITGYKPEDFINNNKLAFNDIIHPDYRELLYENWGETLRKHKAFEYEYQIVTASGELRWVWEQGRGVYDEEGNMTHLEGFILDITDRKNAQEAFRVSEGKFKTLFREMNDLAIYCSIEFDEAGNVVNVKTSDCNDAFLSAFHVSIDRVIGKKPSEIMGIEELPYYAEIIDAIKYGRTFNFTTGFTSIDRQFQVTVIPLQKDEFAMIASDITELARFNDMLMDKNKELENYVYVTSHDLRSPLVNIQGFGARLKKQTDLIGEIIEGCDLVDEKKIILKESIVQKIPHTLDFIFNNVSKMEKMLNGLLQLSRTGRVAMHVHQIPMRDLIIKVIQSVDHQLHEISSEINIGDLPDCYGDENMLNQLFSNIITNAIKYRDSERKLKIDIDGVRRYRKVLYRIKDNGIGIAKDHLDKIWQVFYRVDTKQVQGDGIGLSVVKRIVDKHNGQIWIESTELVGSTFFIELPAEEFCE